MNFQKWELFSGSPGILWHIFEYGSNKSQFSRNKDESVLQETFSTDPNYQLLVQLRVFKKRFLNNFDSCLECKSVSYTMVYTPCFEEIYSNIRNQSGCFCEMSFLKAGLYCTLHHHLLGLAIF